MRIDHGFDIIAVWTQQGSSTKLGYIGQFWHYLQLHKHALNSNSLICGDFNSNRLWDKPNRTWNHSTCVAELVELGFLSAYHLSRNEEQGHESLPTFFLHRNTAKPFHIDYVFAHQSRLHSGWSKLMVGQPEDWLAYSDHMPIIVDL